MFVLLVLEHNSGLDYSAVGEGRVEALSIAGRVRARRGAAALEGHGRGAISSVLI